eukprot:365069-Chlamydomonas_euryale.AAC.27
MRHDAMRHDGAKKEPAPASKHDAITWHTPCRGASTLSGKASFLWSSRRSRAGAREARALASVCTTGRLKWCLRSRCGSGGQARRKWTLLRGDVREGDCDAVRRRRIHVTCVYVRHTRSIRAARVTLADCVTLVPCVTLAPRVA